MSTALLTVIHNMNDLCILFAFGVNILIYTFTFTEFINLLFVPFYIITLFDVFAVRINTIRLIVGAKNLTKSLSD